MNVDSPDSNTQFHVKTLQIYVAKENFLLSNFL